MSNIFKLVVTDRQGAIDDLHAEIKMLRKRLDEQYRWNIALLAMLSRRIDNMEDGK